MEQTTWIEQFEALGGKNPLTSFEPSSFGQVDLARAHPGGLAQLVSSHSATMTNLVRDGVAQLRVRALNPLFKTCPFAPTIV